MSNYLTRQSCGFCFHIRVPKDLQAVVGKTEVRYSLQEGSLRKTKNKSKMVAGQVTGLFKQLRRMSMELTALCANEGETLIL